MLSEIGELKIALEQKTKLLDSVSLSYMSFMELVKKSNNARKDQHLIK